MMMDRKKLGFWTRLVAFALAAIFILSGVFFGIGSNVSYNPLDLFGAGSEKEKEQTTGADDQITLAQEELEADPENPRAIRRLGGLYLQNGQAESAVEVLEQGREVAPDDEVIPLYLGQAHERRAQGVADEEERTAAYQSAGDAYAAAAEIQGDNPQPFLLAGASYEQAGEKSQAIRYWNDYLELEPEGEESDIVKERIAALLSGEETTGAEGAKGLPK